MLVFLRLPEVMESDQTGIAERAWRASPLLQVFVLTGRQNAPRGDLLPCKTAFTISACELLLIRPLATNDLLAHCAAMPPKRRPSRIHRGHRRALAPKSVWHHRSSFILQAGAWSSRPKRSHAGPAACKYTGWTTVAASRTVQGATVLMQTHTRL